MCAGSLQVCGGGAGWLPCDYTGIVGYSLTETCDGLDNDCNNSIDDALTGALCPLVQNGVCTGVREVCQGTAGWSGCNAAIYTAFASGNGDVYESTETTCDNDDNDCDGSVDEALAAAPCTNQNGVCKGSLRTCSGGIFPACDSATFAAYSPDYEDVNETTCDYLDNNCDGSTDEPFQNTQSALGYDTDTGCGKLLHQLRLDLLLGTQRAR